MEEIDDEEGLGVGDRVNGPDEVVFREGNCGEIAGEVADHALLEDFEGVGFLVYQERAAVEVHSVRAGVDLVWGYLNGIVNIMIILLQGQAKAPTTQM